MVSDRVHKTLESKSRLHRAELKRLGKSSEDAVMSENVMVIDQTPQVVGVNTLLLDPETPTDDFIFYFDRLTVLLIDRAVTYTRFVQSQVQTAKGSYAGLQLAGEVSAVCILRGGSILETGLKRVIPDCRTGRILIQTSHRTGEPELHYYKFPPDVASHERVLLLDPQMSSGGAALMAVRVLLDYGVEEKRIVFVTYMAGKMGVNRLMSVFPDIKLVACRIVDDLESRWVEQRYFGC